MVISEVKCKSIITLPSADRYIEWYISAKAFHASSATAAECPALQSRAFLSRLSHSGDRALPSTFRCLPAVRFRRTNLAGPRPG